MPQTGEDQSNEAEVDGAPGAPRPRGQVLSTLNADGSRCWLKPRVSRGRFWHARRIVAWALIVLFALLPHLRIGGEPVLLLDILARRFTILGATFLPTDTVLMALLFITIFIAIFLITALFGRVWCGWACPQTVYMEFLYRPIERLFEGEPGKRRRDPRTAGLRKAMKYIAFFVCSVFLAHTFLAYFVPPSELIAWITSPPTRHPAAFLVMGATTGLMMFDFCFFREQVCLVACPYGRFQAAMLDRDSLIITYDLERGEPRGAVKRRAKRGATEVHLDVQQPEQGDCVDCHLCVTTCPTGIDIREGLQMECIGCAQCIDACNHVMAKLGRPLGLIRYSSQNAMERVRRHFVRPRVIIYPLIIVALLTIFLVLLTGRQSAEAQMLPRQSIAFSMLESGEIGNQTRIRLVNRGKNPASYTFTLTGLESARIIGESEIGPLEPGEQREVGFVVASGAESFSDRGKAEIQIQIRGDDGFEKSLRYRLAGPTRRTRP